MICKKGYYQLDIAEECRYITTFSTHKGLFRDKWLNFGINAVAEIFQETITGVIAGVDNICRGVDISVDIIIGGVDLSEFGRKMD